MGDMGDYWREARDYRRDQRNKHGRPCPKCREFLPKAHPSILLPGQTCRIHGYTDPRSHIKDQS